MNKESLKYILLFIIIILISYLIYRNYYENSILESFQMITSSQRNPLSTYYQSNIDKDTEIRKIHELKHSPNNLSYNESKWNNTWYFKDATYEYYITFLQVNKDLLFCINKKKYVIFGPKQEPYILKDENKPQCIPNMAICKAELNHSENIFYLKSIYCSSDNDGNGDFDIYGTINFNDSLINQFYGKLEKENELTLYSNNDSGTPTTILCDHDTDYTYGPSAEYLLRTSYNVPFPNLKNNITLNPDVCMNTTFGNYPEKGQLENCFITNEGLPVPDDSNGIKKGGENTSNIYGTGCAQKNLIDTDGSFRKCPTNTEKTCFIPIRTKDNQLLNEVGNYTKCETNFEVSLKNQTSLNYAFFKKNDITTNTLDICDSLDGFKSGKYNSAIIMYVNNLSNVETLDYEFFGIEDGKNYLTTKLDIMFPFMNENVLGKLRSQVNTEKSIRLTNCLEMNEITNSNTVNNFSNLLSTCSSEYAKTQQNYEKLETKIQNSNKKNNKNHDDIKFSYLNNLTKTMAKLNTGITTSENNNLIQPTVWTLEFNKNNEGQNTKELTNDCTFILSTSNKYNKEIQYQKYAEFDSYNSKSKLNLFKGGIKQKIILENPYIVDSFDMNNGENKINNYGDISNDYILLSGNLRTTNPKKYLIPNLTSPTQTFKKELYLNNFIKPSGKWLILGFNLTKNLNEGASPNINNKTLINTLKKISQAMNPGDTPGNIPSDNIPLRPQPR